MSDIDRQAPRKRIGDELRAYFGTSDMDEILSILQRWHDEDGGCEATDGCWVEPDGTCPHGHPSWLRKLGLV